MARTSEFQDGENHGFDTKPVIDFEAGRRAFMRSIGVGAVGAAVLGLSGTAASAQSLNNGDILNFALNLEYLEAEFYLRAFQGFGLQDQDTTGSGTLGPVTGGHKVPFTDFIVANYAREIAIHEQAHVQFLRAILGSSKVARPAINLTTSFTAAAQAAGLIGSGATFDAFANDTNFLLAAFIFEDVGVTAYRGASGLLQGGDIVNAAAGLLGTEAYHAGLLRGTLYAKGLYTQAGKISDARDSLDGTSDDDKPIGDQYTSVIVPTDGTALPFGRTPQQVLNIVYLSPNGTKGGFFPAGTNGTLA